MDNFTNARANTDYSYYKSNEDLKKKSYPAFEVYVPAGRKTPLPIDTEIPLNMGFSMFPDDFLIINDIVLSGIPVDGISMSSQSGTVIAETLRSSAPVVTSIGIHNFVVDISLVFPPDKYHVLHRLVAELEHHPLVYIYNNKIRKSLGVFDDAINTIFVLDSGNLKNISEQVDTLSLVLRFNYFNHKPFSSHFWFNTNLPWFDKSTPKQIDSESMPDGFIGYEASSYSMEKKSKKLIEDIKSGKLVLNVNAPNTAVSMPGASDAWIYYADHLDRLVPDINTITDYIGFSVRAFDHFSPPSSLESAGKGNSKTLLSSDSKFATTASIYNAKNATVIHDQSTSTEKEASKLVAASKSSSNSQPFNKDVLKWKDSIDKYAKEFGIPTHVAMIVIQIESNGNMLSVAKNKNGQVVARGIGQFIKGTYDGYAKRLGISTPWEESATPGTEEEGIRMCLAYLQNCAKDAKKFPGTQESWSEAHVIWTLLCYGGTFHAQSLYRAFQKKYGSTNMDITKIDQYFTEEEARQYIIAGMQSSGNSKLISRASAWANDPSQGFKPIRRVKSIISLLRRSGFGNVGASTESEIEAIVKIEQAKERQNNASQKSDDDSFRRLHRVAWIKSIIEKGYQYYSADPKIRNIFFRDIDYHISSDNKTILNTEQGSNIVTSAVSVTFGHRIVPQKLLGQDTYTWQMFGAGNKTGTIVFTFAGAEGRNSADRIKKLIDISRNNAQRFGSLIPEAGSIDLLYDNPFTLERNAIVALMHGDQTKFNSKPGRISIVVTDYEEQSDSDAADKHHLVINFIVQEFAPEQLNSIVSTDVSDKISIIKVLMDKFIVSTDIGSVSGPYQQGANYNFNDAWVIAPNFNYVKFNGYGDNINIPPWESNKLPQWLLDAVMESVKYLTAANKNMPVSSYGRNLFDSFGAKRHIRGSFDNNENKDPSLLATLVGTDNVLEATEDEKNLCQRVFIKWTNNMNIVVNSIINHIGDPEFTQFFGSIGQDKINKLISRIGECYADMHLPSVPNGRVALAPDFYVYDDSKEDAIASSLTDDQNMERLLMMHIKSERESINHYIYDLLLGGSYLSRNLPRILETRKDYLDKYAGESRTGGEFGFISTNKSIIEGTKAWDPVLYRNDDIYTGKSVERWKKMATNGSSPDDAKFSFLDSVIALTPYMRDARGKTWKTALDASPSSDSDLIESIYNEDWASLTYGPNQRYKKCDETLAGTVTNTKDIATNTTISGDYYSGNDQLHNQTIQLDAGQTSTYGNTKAESDAFKASLYKDMASSAIDKFVEGFMVSSGLAFLTSPAQDLANAEESSNIIKNIASGLSNLDHTQVASKFAPGKEDATLAAMARAIGFGAKSKDLSIRRAYPTFKIYFIEDDSEDGEIINGNVVRAFDDFYSTSAVQEIRIIRSRKSAADLAIIRITNIGGKLLRKRFGEEPKYITDNEAITGVAAESPTGIFADTDKENPFEKMILQDGVKVQIRLGYESNPDFLKTVFLGAIVEIAPDENGKILELTCQGFGAELESVELGPLEDGPLYYSSQQALSAAMLTESIVNFGRRSKFNMQTMGEIRSAWTGGEGRGILYSMSPMALIKDWGMGEQAINVARYNFLNDPQDDNIYAPPPSLYASTWERTWNNACTYRPLKQTPWQIFQEHELRHPGYISLAVPYGHSSRMTMFFGGKAQHYWSRPPTPVEMFLSESAGRQIAELHGLSPSELAKPEFAAKLAAIAASNPDMANAIIMSLANIARPSDVSVELGKIFGRYEPFRNFHYLDSSHHILKNNIRTNLDGVFNEVEVLYFENENDIEDPDADDIADNLEALSLGAKGTLSCKLDENIPEEWTRSYREEFPSCITEYMAKRYTQGLFARGLRDCYKGEITILGEPTIKPYDICFIADNTTDMFGPVEVEQVEHIINAESGFITIVTPDLCVEANDYYSASVMDVASAAMAYTYGWSDPNSVLATTALACPLVPLAWMAGVKFIKWTQDGVPVMTTPLVLGGKPFMSTALGQKRISMFLAQFGKWTQYWDDLETAWDRYDTIETLSDFSIDLNTSIIKLISGAGSEAMPLAE